MALDIRTLDMRLLLNAIKNPSSKLHSLKTICVKLKPQISPRPQTKVNSKTSLLPSLSTTSTQKNHRTLSPKSSALVKTQ